MPNTNTVPTTNLCGFHRGSRIGIFPATIRRVGRGRPWASPLRRLQKMPTPAPPCGAETLGDDAVHERLGLGLYLGQMLVALEGLGIDLVHVLGA